MVPSDPFEAAKMRVLMSKLNISGIWGAMGTRYKDPSKFDDYKACLAKFDAMCKAAGD